MAIQILMPALSPTMSVGTIARWLKKEGEQVSAGDLLVEIETDKATMEVEAVDEGILGRILIAEGSEEIAVNTPIALLLEEGEELEENAPITSSAAPREKEGVKEVPQLVASHPVGEKQRGEKPAQEEQMPKERIFISPLARRIAKENGLEISSIEGTGPNGRILRRDVEISLSEVGTKTARQEEKKDAVLVKEERKIESVRHSSMRKVIARRLTESKTQVPHFYVSVDIELDALLKLRSELNKALESENIKISVNDMMIRAVALSLRKLPGVNVQFTETEMLHFEDINISMAVSIPDGLITPVIFQADKKSLREISLEARDLAARARAGKLKPEEFQGGTFSISNMGMFGVKEFAAIINPPQAAILAIAAGEKRPVVKNDELKIATVMTVTLSVDHRAIDGALGAQWLNILRDIVQNPYSLVV